MRAWLNYTIRIRRQYYSCQARSSWGEPIVSSVTPNIVNVGLLNYNSFSKEARVDGFQLDNTRLEVYFTIQDDEELGH